MRRAIKFTVVTAFACGSLAGAALAAEPTAREKAWNSEWKTEAAEKHDKDNKFGATCQDRFTARGTGRVGLGITQFWAKARTTRHWQEEAVKLYGVDYSSWRKAKGKTVSCETKGDMLMCKASANACK